MVLLGRTLYSASASLFQKIYVCYSPARRSVLGKYCAWGLGYHPRPYARQRAQFLPIGTDRPRLVNNFFFLKQKKCFPKEPEWLRAVITTRSSRNGTIFEQVEGRENRGNTNQKERLNWNISICIKTNKLWNIFYKYLSWSDRRSLRILLKKHMQWFGEQIS